MSDYKRRVAEYLRKSRSDDSTESVDQTLARHHQMLADHAARCDISVTKIYKEVVSGDGLFTRPQMIAMLSDIEKGCYTAVLCMDIDRLGRSSTKDSGIIMETLRDNDCMIITPEKVYDLSDEIDEMTVELKSFFARQELKAIRKRLKRGEVATLNAGGHTGAVPYGYKRIWIGKTPSLEEEPYQANIVKMIFAYYLNDGIGTYLIAQKLDTLGITAPGGGTWSRSSVRMILTNPIYKGDIIWNRTKTLKRKKPTDKYRQTNRNEDEWIVARGLHTAIISESDFNQAKELMSRRSSKTKFTGTIKNPFSGLMFCTNCGKPIQRQLDNGRERLLCTTKGCTSSISMYIIYEMIKDMCRQIFQDYRFEPDNRVNEKAEILSSRIRSLNSRLTALSEQYGGLNDLLEQGVYDIPTFFERQKILGERIEAAKKEKDALTEELDQCIRSDKQTIVPTFDDMLRDWHMLDPARINAALKQLIGTIGYKRDSRLRKNSTFLLEIRWNI